MKGTTLALTVLLGACGGDSTGTPTDPSAMLESIVVSSVTDPLPAIGSAASLTATGRYADGPEEALGWVVWSSSASDVAEVDGRGRVTATGRVAGAPPSFAAPTWLPIYYPPESGALYFP